MLIKVIRQSDKSRRVWTFMVSLNENGLYYELIGYYENLNCIYDNVRKQIKPVIPKDVWNEAQEKYIKSLVHIPKFEVWEVF